MWPIPALIPLVGAMSLFGVVLAERAGRRPAAVVGLAHVAAWVVQRRRSRGWLEAWAT